MTVSVVKVRRIRNSGIGWALGLTHRGHEVKFVMGWRRLRGIADDVAHGDDVVVRIPNAAILSIKNPRMRRAA